MNLISSKGTLIVATLERLSGCALIVPGSVRPEPSGGFSFDYEGTTDIYWDEQRTVVENDERVFVDEEGTEYLESQLRLVPQQEEQGRQPTPTPEETEQVITVAVEGGIVQDVQGIPPGVVVRIVDYDTDGADDESLTTLPSGEKAFCEWRRPGCSKPEATR
jgi:hypothetical protein